MRVVGVGVLLSCSALSGCSPSEAWIAPATLDASTPPSSQLAPLGDRLPVDKELQLSGLAGAVDIVRDKFGIAHIYATSIEDAWRVEGYLMASDRGLQMEWLRRTAQGRTAEIAAKSDPDSIDRDIVFRTLGLPSLARDQYAALSSSDPTRRALDAFADGVSQFNARLRSGTLSLPTAWKNAQAAWFTPWEGADSLAVLKLHTLSWSFWIENDLELTRLLQAMRGTFRPDATDPTLVRRRGILADLLRFNPATGATVFGDFPETVDPLEPNSDQRSGDPAEVPDGLFQSLSPLRTALRTALKRETHTFGLTSNALALAPSRSASGQTLFATDLHGPMTNPNGLWWVHLNVAGAEKVQATGAALPGVPGLLAGFNERLAWTPSSSWNDEADAYLERLGSTGETVRFEGGDVPLSHRKETIGIEGGSALDMDVAVVPHHGPLLPAIVSHAVAKPEASSSAISVRWTGFKATGELAALVGMLQADTVGQARTVLGAWGSGGQNFVLAAADGSLAAVSRPIPARDRRAFTWDSLQQRGRLPCFVLPGQGGTEWTGEIPVASLPAMVDPARGWVLSANADPAGLTHDNDPSNDQLPEGAPVFLSCHYDLGFRQARLEQRLSTAVLGTDQLLSLQHDWQSPLGARLTKHLRAAIDRALAEQQEPGKYPGLSKVVGSARFAAANLEDVAAALDDWSAREFAARTGVRVSDGVPTEAGEDARASKATALFNAWLLRLRALCFGDEIAAAGLEGIVGDLELRALIHLIESDPTTLATYDKEQRDSILWDDTGTPELESRDDRMITALLDAVDALGIVLGAKRDDWRWGLLHTVRLEPFGPGFVSIPSADDKSFPRGYPRPGDLFAVDSASFDWASGQLDETAFSVQTSPLLRLVVELTPSGPLARMAMAGDQAVGVALTERPEEVEYWRANLDHDVPFGLEAVIAAARTRTTVRTK